MLRSILAAILLAVALTACNAFASPPPAPVATPTPTLPSYPQFRPADTGRYESYQPSTSVPAYQAPARLSADTSSQGCPSAADAAYFAQARPIMLATGDALNRLGALFADANMLMDPWMVEVFAVLVELDSYADATDQLVSPRTLQYIHSDMLRLADILRQVVGFFAEGIAIFDPEMVALAEAALFDFNRLAAEATVKIEGFCRVGG